MDGEEQARLPIQYRVAGLYREFHGPMACHSKRTILTRNSSGESYTKKSPARHRAGSPAYPREIDVFLSRLCHVSAHPLVIDWWVIITNIQKQNTTVMLSTLPVST